MWDALAALTLLFVLVLITYEWMEHHRGRKA